MGSLSAKNASKKFSRLGTFNYFCSRSNSHDIHLEINTSCNNAIDSLYYVYYVITQTSSSTTMRGGGGAAAGVVRVDHGLINYTDTKP